MPPQIPAIDINLIEGIWVATSLSGAVVTGFAIVDAWGDRAAVKLLNGPIRRRIAHGALRRELFRLVVQILLLTVAIPAIFTPGDVPLSLPIIALMGIPITLLVQTLLDYNDRHALNILTAVAAMKLEAADAKQRNTTAQLDVAEQKNEAYRHDEEERNR